jgi:glutathione S-transferase
VQKTANPIAAAKAFYTANNATLNAAADALVNLNMNEGLKRAARDVLAPVRKILDGLDSLTKVHPFLAGEKDTIVW